MNTEAIKEKTKTVMTMTDNKELLAVCEIVVSLVEVIEEKELGFKK